MAFSPPYEIGKRLEQKDKKGTKRAMKETEALGHKLDKKAFEDGVQTQ